MAYQLIKKKIFPCVHSNELKFHLSADATKENATNIQCLYYDEALGDPTSCNTNPEHASFSVKQRANCYPDSRVNFARINLEMGLKLSAITSDNMEVLKVGVIPYHVAFLENLTALNDKTSEEVEDILELQHETTNRSTYPLWNGTKLAGTHLETGSENKGLTTNTNIEAIDIDISKLYDCLQFYTNAGKVRKSLGKIRWLNVSKRRNLRMSIKVKPKTKRMNPYTAFGVIVVVPRENEFQSMQVTGEAGAIDHLTVKASYRFNEWNENMDHTRT